MSNRMIRKFIAALTIGAMLCTNVHAALSDYGPVLQYYGDSNTDLDEPTGTTPSNVAQDYIWENFDGTGTTTTATGFRIKISAGGSRRIALVAPPGAENTFLLETATNALTAGQYFIVAFKRASGTWSIHLDADASGGMTSHTPNANGIGAAAFTECGGITFGEAATTTSSPFDGGIDWLVAFNVAVSDADLQLAAWDDEANLKAAWLGAGGGSLLLRRRRGP